MVNNFENLFNTFHSNHKTLKERYGKPLKKEVTLSWCFFSIDTKCLLLDGFSGGSPVLFIQLGQAATVSWHPLGMMAGIVGGKVRKERGRNVDEEEQKHIHSQVRLVRRRNKHYS